MNRRLAKPAAIVMMILCHAAAGAQEPEDHPQPATTAGLTSIYQRALLQQRHIINGREYVPRLYDKRFGIPFFRNDSLVTGSMVYDRISYDNLLIKLDLVTNTLIMPDLSDRHLIALVPEKISSFTIYGLPFIRLTGHDGLAAGFYQLLYDDEDTRLLKRETRSFSTRATSFEVETHVTGNTARYFKIRGSYHPVKSLGAAVALLQPEKNAYRSFIQKNKKRYRKGAADEVLAELLHYHASQQKK